MNNAKAILSIKDISFSYVSQAAPIKKQILLDKISLSLRPGEIVSIVGTNGSGKSTLLNLVAGFLQPVSGSISITPGKVSMVFQDIGLLEWKTVMENVELSLLSSDLQPIERKKMASSALKLLGVLAAKHKFPKELSGGMKQRVAIARAIAPNPKILLLDEPFSSLDWATKHNLQKELLKIIKRKNIGVLLVSHDLAEARFLSDKIFLLSKGKLRRFGPTQCSKAIEN